MISETPFLDLPGRTGRHRNNPDASWRSAGRAAGHPGSRSVLGLTPRTRLNAALNPNALA
jgi:hypothetical protein